MKADYLLLRGFEGILSGMGLSEIEIDFSDLPNGIIVFDGPNGRGKTTIVDNMHHFRVMPSKVNNSYSPEAFSFYEETYGSGACKVFISRMKGTRHKSVVSIDATRRRQKCYLYEEVNGNWRPLNPDGGTESFDRAVEAVFGTPQLYFISNFRDQRAKSFSRYSKGDIKEILAELLGIADIKVLSEKAGRIRKALQDRLGYLVSTKEDLLRVISGKDEKASKTRSVQSDLSHLAESIRSLESQRQEKERKLSETTTKIALQEERQKAKDKLLADMQARKNDLEELRKSKESRLTAFRTKAAAMKEKIARTGTLLANLGSLRLKAQELKGLEEKVSNLKNSAKLCDERYVEVNKRISEIQTVEKILKEKEGELEGLRLTRQHAIDRIEAAVRELKAKVRRLAEYRCDATGASSCPFLTDAREAKRIIPAKEAELRKLAAARDPQQETLLRELADLRRRCATAPPLRKESEQLLSTKRVLEDEMQKAEERITALKDETTQLAEAEQAEKELPGLKAELTALEKEKEEYLQETDRALAVKEAEIKARESEAARIAIAPTLQEAKEKIVQAVSTLSSRIDGQRSEEAALRKEAGAVDEALKRIAESETKCADLDKEIDFLKGELSEWAIMEKALGNDGIIPLEIDDAGPAIASVANELLRVYDSPFTVGFNTQEMTRTGKLREGFDIPVFDANTNKSKSIRKLSGGEATIVEDAVAKAICICNKMRNGKDLATIYTDERDGALDPEKKRAYFRMKQKVLALGGYQQEFCITHTPELLAMASAVISLAPGGITITTNN
ncbi:MAG: Chromosome partition protein Smc [Syntrophorhabdaceae bacterium PtaU1.Bin034]|nr:MAG: Chromosome partition protein Smc [Syntrophorhabdaceae bacterium PtaU1.Bin034]